MSGKEYGAGFRESEGVGYQVAAVSISLVVMGRSNSVIVWVNQSLMNTFASVYTLCTQDTGVADFSPKGATLTSFFYLFFCFRSFRSNSSTNSKYILIFFSFLILVLVF